MVVVGNVVVFKMFRPNKSNIDLNMENLEVKEII